MTITNEDNFTLHAEMITWRDAFDGPSGWHPIDDVVGDEMWTDRLITSVGFVLSITPTHIVLAGSCDPSARFAGSCHAIPLSSVMVRTRLVLGPEVL